MEGRFERPTPEVRDCMDYLRREVSVTLQKRPSIQTVSKALATSRKTAPVSLFSPKFLVILSTKWGSCKDVLCLGLKPSCSSHISPRWLTSCKILADGTFSNGLLNVQETNGSIGWGHCRILPWFKDRDHSVLLYCRKVIRIANLS